MSSLKIDLTQLDLGLSANTDYTISIDAGLVTEVGNNRSPSPAQSDVKSFTSFATAPAVTSTATNSIDGYLTTATLGWDRNVQLKDGSIYIYNGEGVYRTIAATSSSLALDVDSLEVTIYNEALPEDDYYIGWSSGIVRDFQGIIASAQSTDSLLGWTVLALSTITNETYDSGLSNPEFGGNWYEILDRSPDANEQYTLTLSATSGTFTATVGTTVGNTWTYTATRQEIDAVNSLHFDATVKNMNWDLPFTTKLERDGVQIAVRNNTLVGIPYNLPSMPLVSNTYTNSIGVDTILTVVANTSSNIPATSSPAVFKTTATTLGTSTFVGNTATLTIPAGSLPIGTYDIHVEWAGATDVPKFNSTSSNVITQDILDKSQTTPTLVVDRFYLNDLVSPNTNTFTTSTLSLANIYPTHKPAGTVSLYDGATLLATAAINSSTTSTGVFVWKPIEFTQIDQGAKTLTAVFNGDGWNYSTSTTVTFTATTKRNANLVLTTNTSSYVRPATVSINVTTNDPFDNKLLTFASSTGTFGQGIFLSTSTTFQFDARYLNTGTNTVRSSFIEDFSFYSTFTNYSSFTISKGTPDTASLSFNVPDNFELPYKPNKFEQPVTFNLNFGNTPPKGELTTQIKEVSPYTIIPTGVGFSPTPGWGEPGYLYLYFVPVDRVKMLDFNIKYSDVGAPAVPDRVKLVVNDQIYEVIPGASNTYCHILNYNFINELDMSYDFWALELYQGTNMLGDIGDRSSPLFNTSTWLSLSTATVSLILDGTQPIQYSNTSTIIDTRNVIDQATTSSIMTVPYGYWKVSTSIGSDNDSNYNSPNTAITHICRQEPNIGNNINITSLFGHQGSILWIEFERDFFNTRDNFISNREYQIKIYYRVIPKSEYPTYDSFYDASLHLDQSDTVWRQGPLFGEFNISMDGNLVYPNPNLPYYGFTQSNTYSVDYRNLTRINLTTYANSSFPIQENPSVGISIDGIDYWSCGCYFELTYTGSEATSIANAVPGRYIKGYVYANYTFDETKDILPAFIIQNSEL